MTELRKFLLAWILGFTAAAPVSSSGSSLAVLTFNIRYGTAQDEGHSWDVRKEAVAEVFRVHDPDLAGLQEALDFQVDFLRTRFKGTYTLVGEGREGGTQGEFSPLLYRSDRFLLLRAGRFWLSETPDVVGSKTWASLPRIVTWVELFDRIAQHNLLVLNTHWAHDSEEARLKSAHLVYEKVGQINSGTGTVILMGDFNCVPGSPPHQALVGGDVGGFQDSSALEQGGLKSTFHGFRGLAREGGPIDWILFKGGLRAVEYRVVDGEHLGELPSDHYPVFAKLEW